MGEIEFSIHFSLRTQDSRVLSLDSTPDVLRAISVVRLMERWGYHLRCGFNDFSGNVDQLYNRTKQVERYKAFVSHDWASGRFEKFLALCAYHNLLPAVVVSLVISVGVTVLQTVEVLPSWADEQLLVANCNFIHRTGRWPILLGPISYFVTLFFWQRIRSLMRLEQANLFFDRFCIHQSDEDLKTKAILGLGGFIERSEKFLLLWSPRYFTRLWCVYEVAAFTYLKKQRASMVFVPMQFVVCLFVGQCLLSLVVLSTLSPFTETFLLIPLLVACFIAISGTLAVGRRFSDIMKIRDQLTSFRLDNAACFCCSVNHTDEKSGATILCDRQLVYRTIEPWFRSSGSTSISRNDGLQGLAAFDSYVTGPLAVDLVNRVTGRLSLLLYIAIYIYPYFWLVCEEISFFIKVRGQPNAWRILLNSFGTMCVYIPLCTRLVIAAGGWIANEPSSRGPCLLYLRRAGILVVTVSGMTIVGGLPLYLGANHESPIPNVICLVVFFVAFLLLSATRPIPMSVSKQTETVKALEEKTDATEPAVIGYSSDQASTPVSGFANHHF